MTIEDTGWQLIVTKHTTTTSYLIYNNYSREEYTSTRLYKNKCNVTKQVSKNGIVL